MYSENVIVKQGDVLMCEEKGTQNMYVKCTHCCLLNI